MVSNTLIVDGNYLIKRSFESKGNYITKEFGDITAFFISMLTLRTLVKKLSIDKCVFIFDDVNSGLGRHKILRNYKSNRKNKHWYTGLVLSDSQIKFEEQRKESILKNTLLLKNTLNELFIRVIESSAYSEADDLISQYIKDYHKKENIYLFTNDRDLLQNIIYDTVKVILGNKKDIIFTKDNFNLEFPYHYSNIVLVKTFVGDTSDNIYGIKGLGLTTFLKFFPDVKTRTVTIDEILNQTDELIKERELTKKKPLLALENIRDGVNSEGDVLGEDFYINNHRVIDLTVPFIEKDMLHELFIHSTYPLDESDRGSKNLLNILNSVGFFSIWNGNVASFCEPFYPIIFKEKKMSKNS